MVVASDPFGAARRDGVRGSPAGRAGPIPRALAPPVDGGECGDQLVTTGVDHRHSLRELGHQRLGDSGDHKLGHPLPGDSPVPADTKGLGQHVPQDDLVDLRESVTTCSNNPAVEGAPFTDFVFSTPPRGRGAAGHPSGCRSGLTRQQLPRTRPLGRQGPSPIGSGRRCAPHGRGCNRWPGGGTRR